MLEEQLNYMYRLERFGIKLGLFVMEDLLRELDNPHTTFRSIHITGTTGKGSVAAMLESVLRTYGYSTALYTSPHLFAFNERIRLNNKTITDQELSSLIDDIRAAAERAGVSPTFFEFTTALAFLYFARHQPDIAIIEVGMGGRLDATNVLTPLVSVITNIGLDHTFLLGQTKQDIAVNKAGIIKNGVPAVTGEADTEILEILRVHAHHKKSPLRHALTEIKTTRIHSDRHSQTFLTLSVRKGLMSQINGLKCTLPLVGDHQRDNVATVLTVLDALGGIGLPVSAPAIQDGLAATAWPGRLEVISDEPFILVDGAHNPPSLQALISFITHPSIKPSSYDVLVLGVKKDKDLGLIKDKLAPLFRHIIATEGSYEPMLAGQLARELNAGEAIPDAAAATRRGLDLIGPAGSLVITGSLYMIPSAMAYLRAHLPAAAPPTSPR